MTIGRWNFYIECSVPWGSVLGGRLCTERCILVETLESVSVLEGKVSVLRVLYWGELRNVCGVIMYLEVCT